MSGEHNHFHPSCEDHQQITHQEAILTIRSHTGISGDILLAGMATLVLDAMDIPPESATADEWLNSLAASIMPQLAGSLNIRQRQVSGISGWQAHVDLPHEHEHRNLIDIQTIIAQSEIQENAKKRALSCFELLADCEAHAHGIALSEVHFHEVGALDSILDVCAVCDLYARLGEPAIISSALPVADGQIECCHGLLPAPAPAVLRLLRNIPVTPYAGTDDAGELLTPTGVALLCALETSYGSWPSFKIQATSLVYGQREFAGAANGVIFALGVA